MALLRSKRSKRSRPYCVQQQEELVMRHTLLAHARNGDNQAQKDLMTLYGVRVYSASERSSLQVYDVPHSS